jgi:predicted transcriptional regulator
MLRYYPSQFHYSPFPTFLAVPNAVSQNVFRYLKKKRELNQREVRDIWSGFRFSVVGIVLISEWQPVWM